ncbi:hybrid sensor histidine kinase/response regulator [Myxacorys almedinensis]|uniref:histidine kinase n=1 Tax=Myxacorys almedinensis A TaxID=2690445 RepID=A0A8J7Z7Q2_9CYAN|nr:ATP-binding protein [Myxacorys almedinensis]NDJ19666.1 response regulator [Myxacorys almedinensis A]
MSFATVLIVEDERIIALDIQTSLQSAGYGVVAIATSATEALESVKGLSPDLVLMDIRIRGDRDGVETAEQIRADYQIPVVYLTAHADENTLQRAKLTEPFGYILKPFEDRELITTIEIALSRHKAEAAIQTALRQEKELNELKTRFVSVVSHEFRNPLNAILFSTELLQRYGAQLAIEKREVYLERIQLSVRRMNQLLSDVLTLAETEAGKLDYSPCPLDLLKLCQDLVDEIQPHEQGSVIQFRHTDYLHPSLPWGCHLADRSPSPLPRLDERLLRHILINLLSNSIKYSTTGEPIVFALSSNDDSVTFRIQDQGIGIPQADHANLFQSFYRASNAKTIPGTGLGLSIVKQCVDLHKGTIAVESAEGEGTLFTVTLPLDRSAHENDPRH